MADNDRKNVQELQSELDATRRELARVKAELALLKSSPQLELSVLWQMRQRLFPAGTLRERVAKRGLRAVARAVRAIPGTHRAAGAPAPHAPAPVTYDEWIRRREPDGAQLDLQRALAGTFPLRPLISVVCPVFEPGAAVLADTIASVRTQTYDNWELVLVKAGPQPADVDAVLAACAEEPRIVVVPLDRNLGIAGNTNRGVEAARGEYVSFLDHDDLIAPDALYEVARLLNRDPGADAVYFDEDKVTADGRTRCEPYFKPDWSPEHLLSINFLMHAVVRRDLVQAVGGLDSRFDGAQDWDLALRLLEHGVKPRHIPRVLYHWRRVPGSSAAVADAKPWALERQAPCVKAHLERRGFTGVAVDAPTIGVLRPSWRGRGTRVSIIIPTRDRATLVRKCLSSIFAITQYDDFEVLLVDTGSTDPDIPVLYKELAEEPRLRLLRREGPFNYSAVNNWAATEASGDILLFLNNDIEVLEPGWLAELARWAELDEIGCVGAKLLYPDGTIQHAGLVVGMEGHASQIYRFEPGDHHWGVFGSPESYRNPLAVTGACLAVHRRVFEQVGGFDEVYRLCYNDIDLCLRVAAAGYRNLFTPFAKLIHHEGASRGFTVPHDEVLRASIDMFPLVLNGDPSFNPSLSYASVSPQFAGNNEPEDRANRIALIARSFGVYDAWIDGIEQEIRGTTSRYTRYAPLMSRTRERLSPAVARPRPDRLRVLIVSHDLTRTGAPMAVAHLTEYLHRNGHQVTVVSPKPGPRLEEFEARGAQVIVAPGVLMAPYAAGDLFETHDVVLANTVLAWRVVLSAAAAHRPCVWFIHESNFGVEYARAHPDIAKAFAAAGRVVYVSTETANRYRGLNTGREKVIHLGIPPVSGRGGAFEKVPGKLYVLLAGSIEERKGHDVLVSALRHVPETVRRNIEVLFLGGVLESQFEARLRTAAERLGSIRFLPQTSFSETIDVMATADVVVCASRDDPSPLVVLEAMALGRAVLSTRVGAVPELISDGESGLLVDKEDARAMAAALVRLHDDRDLIARLGHRARQRFEEHLTLERFGADWLEELQAATAVDVAAAVGSHEP